MAMHYNCPECKKRTVTLRLKAFGEDCYACRSCDFSFFITDCTQADAEASARFRDANPLPVSPRQLEDWVNRLRSVYTWPGDGDSHSRKEGIIHEISQILARNDGPPFTERGR